MTETLRSIASWATDNWPGLLIPLILFGGAAMVRYDNPAHPRIEGV